jgi:hypothetical protein
MPLDALRAVSCSISFEFFLLPVAGFCRKTIGGLMSRNSVYSTLIPAAIQGRAGHCG